MTDTAPTSELSWVVRHAAVIGLVLITVGLVGAVAGQRLLSAEIRPAKQYIDGRYWTITPATCAGLGIDSRSACVAYDTSIAAQSDRSHQNLLTVRAVGVVSLLTGFLLVFIGFVSTRRAAERAMSPSAD